MAVLKFRRWSYIRKKIRSEDYKRKLDWRHYKKTHKDKSRSGRPCYQDYGKKFLMKLDHKKRRRWSKGRIDACDYDLDRGWRKTFVDPWCWE